MMKAKGSPKPVASGKKGNVGGMMTPGRHGNHKVAMMAGMKNLVAAGPGTKKTASISNMPRPEGAVHIDAGNLKKASGTNKMAAGSPKDIKGSGHKGVMPGARPEGPIMRDSMGTVKP